MVCRNFAFKYRRAIADSISGIISKKTNIKIKMNGIRGIFTTKDGKIVVGQFPNAPLILWAFFACISYIYPLSQLENEFQIISSFFLFVWAYLELAQGVNIFRRILGFIGILYIIFKIFI